MSFVCEYCGLKFRHLDPRHSNYCKEYLDKTDTPKPADPVVDQSSTKSKVSKNDSDVDQTKPQEPSMITETRKRCHLEGRLDVEWLCIHHRPIIWELIEAYDALAKELKGAKHRLVISQNESLLLTKERDSLKLELDNCWADRGSHWKNEYAKVCGQRDLASTEIASYKEEIEALRVSIGDHSITSLMEHNLTYAANRVRDKREGKV